MNDEPQSTQISRRDLLKLMSASVGAVAAAPLLAA